MASVNSLLCTVGHDMPLLGGDMKVEALADSRRLAVFTTSPTTV